jgi:hypothetical protein
MRAGGTRACKNTSPCGPSTSRLSPLSKRWASSASLRASSRSKISRRPSATVAAGFYGAVEQRDAVALVEALQEHLDLAAAGQSDTPGRFVFHAEGEGLGVAVLEDVFGLGDHLAFHAAARDRALELAVGGHHHLPADTHWRRAPGADHGGHRHLALRVEPLARGRQHVVGFESLGIGL